MNKNKKNQKMTRIVLDNGLDNSLGWRGNIHHQDGPDFSSNQMTLSMTFHAPHLPNHGKR